MTPEARNTQVADSNRTEAASATLEQELTVMLGLADKLPTYQQVGLLMLLCLMLSGAITAQTDHAKIATALETFNTKHEEARQAKNARLSQEESDVIRAYRALDDVERRGADRVLRVMGIPIGSDTE